ncbi:nucleotidyltransferase family protein [uncultured Psychrobacter sp.]|uniref:nucleotidyltransferase family protein n=1 Tax=uncultured Psychrobacter sp. TaxID=259303 RepID=UPI0034585D54
MSAPNHAVIVLASGLSQRLGQPKQLLNKNDEPLISHMLKLALTTKPKVISVVIPKDNLLIADVIARWVTKEPKIKTVTNPNPEIGMGHSLYLGIESLTQLANSNDSRSDLIERVLIMGVDQVLLDLAHLCQLLDGNSTVVASGYGSWRLLDNDKSEKGLKERPINNIVGLPLVIDYALLKQWQTTLGGDKGLRHLIRALPPDQIKTINNQQLSYDIDTPAQLNYAKAQDWIGD